MRSGLRDTERRTCGGEGLEDLVLGKCGEIHGGKDRR
jgi:hypothetical protein